jgi:uncharacterized protein YndB with AHSA1/START domain
MGMLTSGRVEIAAPAMDVFDWLINPVKLTAWLGGSGGMPEDAAQLHVGWSSTSDTAAGDVKVEITTYEPPTHLVYRSTYSGGDSISTYTLNEVDGRTTLALEGDTDWGRPKGGLEAALDQALTGQPESMRVAAEAQIEKLEDQLEHGAFDSQAQPQLQQAVDAQLVKLKALIEGGVPTAKN